MFNDQFLPPVRAHNICASCAAKGKKSFFDFALRVVNFASSQAEALKELCMEGESWIELKDKRRIQKIFKRLVSRDEPGDQVSYARAESQDV